MSLSARLTDWNLEYTLERDYGRGLATLSLTLGVDPEVATEIARLAASKGPWPHRNITWPELEALLMSEDEEDAFLQKLVAERTSSRKRIECLIAANAEGAKAIKELAELKAALKKAVA